jgi:hypothetical protein
MILLWVDAPQNMIPYDIIVWTIEKYTIFNVSKDNNGFRVLIT